MSKKLFTAFPQIENNQPMTETEFWAWIRGNEDRYDGFISALLIYLSIFGYDIQRQRITSEQLKNHRTTYEHFMWRKARGLEI